MEGPCKIKSLDMEPSHSERWKNTAGRVFRAEVVISLLVCTMGIISNTLFMVQRDLVEVKDELSSLRKNHVEMKLKTEGFSSKIIDSKVQNVETPINPLEDTFISNRPRKWDRNEINRRLFVQDKLLSSSEAESSNVYDRKLEAKTSATECNANTTKFQLELKLDNSPEQTDWKLIYDHTNEIVTSGMYTSVDLRKTIHVLECIEPGPYTFELNDSNGDGISCAGGTDCYTIFIDNHKIEASLFNSKVQHFFDSTSRCPIDSTFILQFQQNTMGIDIFWRLIRRGPEEDIEFELLANDSIDNPFDENARKSYFACLPAGIYSLKVFDLVRETAPCGDPSSCYRVFINDEFFINGKELTNRNTVDFYLSKYGTVRKRVCTEQPLLAPVNHINNSTYDERTGQILEVIQSMSSVEQLRNPNTNQYKAACFIVFDDHSEIMPRNLVERYIMAVFTYSINSFPEIELPANQCDYDRVQCDNEERIIKIRNEGQTNGMGRMSELPQELFHLRFLEKLIIKSHLVGTIPKEVGRVINLKTLDLRFNQLTGTIPTEVGNLVNLEELLLWSNDLTGSIPSEIKHCSNLKALALGHNNLEGAIPSEVFSLDQLVFVWLSENKLNGTISTNINQLKNINQLYLDKNHLRGEIPVEIGGLATAQKIHLEFNRLGGTLPKEIGNLTSLDEFSISGNNMEGRLPDAFGNFNKISLDLSTNDFSGEIPKSVWNGTKEVFLHGNDLTGSIPQHVCVRIDDYTVDGSFWFRDRPKVSCSCCKPTFCYVWESSSTQVGKTRRLECSQSSHYNIELPQFNNENIESGNESWLHLVQVKDKITNITFEKSIGRSDLDTLNMCLSPTGCYSISMDGNHLYDFQFSNFSSTEPLTKKDQCESVDICGKLVTPDSDERRKLNHLTQLLVHDMSDLKDKSSLDYKTLCWIMNDPDLDKFETCDGTLVQRYALAKLFISQNQFNIQERQFHTCEWDGVKCDESHKFVEKLTLKRKNFTATLITELGVMKRLKYLDLSDNELKGTIEPKTFSHMDSLENLNISSNKFSGEIPRKACELPNIKSIDLSRNSFEGTLSNGTSYSTTLEYFNMSNNLIFGSIPQTLTHSNRLQSIDLSRNNLKDVIPPNFDNLKNLTTLMLHENQLFGSIPFQIFNSRIKVLTLHQNDLTGSIPIQAGELINVEHFTLSHNSLKGEIPGTLKQLTKVLRLNLHQNLLTGTAPIIDLKSNAQFITDCGEPSFALPAPLECTSCTICCNSEDKCMRNFPMNYLDWEVVPFVCGGIALLYFVYFVFRTRFLAYFGDERSPSSIFSDDSVYCFVFTNSHVAHLIYVVTAALQMAILFQFLRASDPNNPDSDWEFTMTCPSNSMECLDENSVNSGGWFLFTVLNFLFLGTDILNFVLQLGKAVILKDFQLFLSGSILLFLTSWTIYTSATYNWALAETNTDVIVNAVILLFINDLDERVLSLFHKAAPTWTENQVHIAKETMMGKMKENNVERVTETPVINDVIEITPIWIENQEQTASETSMEKLEESDCERSSEISEMNDSSEIE